MDLMNIVKIAAILVALIVVRVGVQALLRSRSGPGGRFGDVVPFVLPPMITGGPMFLAIPVAAVLLRDPEVPSFLVYLVFGGAVLLGMGLAGLLYLLMRQRRQIDELTSLLPVQTESHT